MWARVHTIQLQDVQQMQHLIWQRKMHVQTMFLRCNCSIVRHQQQTIPQRRMIYEAHILKRENTKLELMYNAVCNDDNCKLFVLKFTRCLFRVKIMQHVILSTSLLSLPSSFVVVVACDFLIAECEMSQRDYCISMLLVALFFLFMFGTCLRADA